MMKVFSSALASLILLQKVEACPGPGITSRSSVNAGHDRSLMVDGIDTVPGRFPYHTQVGCCSGALIAPDVVLTAAHDVPPIDVVVGSKVSVGAYHTVQLQNPDGDAVQVRTVKEAFIHPKYTVIHNDFAVLILDEPVQDASIISLNRDPKIPKPYEEVTILGTGTFDLEHIQERATVLQEGQTTYLPNSECSQAHDPARGVSYGGEFLDETNLCTKGGADGCVFDSGGPIILKGEDEAESNNDLLLALVSYGVDCADTVYPAVNARISAGAPWIDKMVCTHSVDPPSDFECDNISEDLFTESLLTTSSMSLDNQELESSFHRYYSAFLGLMCLVMIVVGAGIIVLRRKRLLNGLNSTTTRTKQGNNAPGEIQNLLPDAEAQPTSLYTSKQ